MELNKKTVKTIALLIVLGVGLHWLLTNLALAQKLLGTIWGLVFPFFLGLIIAFLLNIPMSFLERVLFKNRPSRLKRPLCFVLALVLVVGVLALALFLIIPGLTETVQILAADMPGYIQNAQNWLMSLEEYIPIVQDFVGDLNLDINWQEMLSSFISFLQSGAGSLFTSAWGVAYSIISTTASFFIGLVFACYVLLDKERLHRQAKGLLQAYIPAQRYKKLLDTCSLAFHTFSRFVAGQLTEAIVLCVLFSVLLWILQFNYALLIGVLIGLFSIIPIFGATLACILGALLLLVSQGFWPALFFVILFLVVQQIDGNFIYPHIVGNSVGLPPIWVMVAVLVGGSAFGLAGMLFFIPLGSVLYTLLRKDARARLEKKGIELPPTPEPPHKKRGKRAKGKKPNSTDENGPST